MVTFGSSPNPLGMTVKKIDKEFYEITWKDMKMYHSYGNWVAFSTPNRGLVVHTNIFGEYTAKHLYMLDGATVETRYKRLKHDKFMMYFEHEFEMRSNNYVDTTKEDNEEGSTKSR